MLNLGLFSTNLLVKGYSRCLLPHGCYALAWSYRSSFAESAQLNIRVSFLGALAVSGFSISKGPYSSSFWGSE